MFVRFEHISIQLDARASAPKQTKKRKDFIRDLTLCIEISQKKEIDVNELLSGLSMLIGNKEYNMSSYYLFYFKLMKESVHYISKELNWLFLRFPFLRFPFLRFPPRSSYGM